MNFLGPLLLVVGGFIFLKVFANSNNIQYNNKEVSPNAEERSKYRNQTNESLFN